MADTAWGIAEGESNFFDICFVCCDAVDESEHVLVDPFVDVFGIVYFEWGF